MGEDFLRRKNEGFVRRRDAHFERLVEPDLFSGADTREQLEVVGHVSASIALANGDELWALDVPPHDPVHFFHGEREAVVCNPLASDHLRDEARRTGGGLIAKVVELSSEDGLAILAVAPLRRRESS